MEHIPPTLADLIAQAMRNVKDHNINFNDSVYTIWTKDGRLHRENGPAIVCNISESWYKNGKLHRNDGPAVCVKAHPVYPKPIRMWFINGVGLTKEVEEWLDQYKLLPDDTTTWTNQHKIYFKLTFGEGYSDG